MDGRAVYLLFPHPTEPATVIATANEELHKDKQIHTLAGGLVFRGHPAGVRAEPGFYWLSTVQTNPLAVVTALYRVDWQHAPLLVYRSVTDDSWSYLRITRRVAPLWGDKGEEVT